MNHIKTEEILEVLPVVLESGKVSNLVKYGNLSQSNLDRQAVASSHPLGCG